MPRRAREIKQQREKGKAGGGQSDGAQHSKRGRERAQEVSKSTWRQSGLHDDRGKSAWPRAERALSSSGVVCLGEPAAAFNEYQEHEQEHTSRLLK
eukprot:6173240-Pleurochrysis_carterae.AAC.3